MKLTLSIIVVLSILLTGCSPSVNPVSTQAASAQPEEPLPPRHLDTTYTQPHRTGFKPGFYSHARSAPAAGTLGRSGPLFRRSARARVKFIRTAWQWAMTRTPFQRWVLPERPKSFLGIYDLPGRYSFTPEYQFLDETVKYYSGSFNRLGK